jgi:sulfur carrier protein ThiS
MVTVRFPDGRMKTVPAGSCTAEGLLARLGINPYGVILSRDGRLITEDTPLDEDDEIRLIDVVHGG